jgi:hypothetical protein
MHLFSLEVLSGLSTHLISIMVTWGPYIHQCTVLLSIVLCITDMTKYTYFVKLIVMS